MEQLNAEKRKVFIVGDDKTEFTSFGVFVKLSSCIFTWDLQKGNEWEIRGRLREVCIWFTPI